MLGLNMSGLLPDRAPLLAATATVAAPCSNMADQLVPCMCVLVQAG